MFSIVKQKTKYDVLLVIFLFGSSWTCFMILLFFNLS